MDWPRDDLIPCYHSINFGALLCSCSLTNDKVIRAVRNLKDYGYENKIITSKDVYNHSKRKRRRNDDDDDDVNDDLLITNNNYISNSNVDRISDLPNDVLLHLLSFVDMKSAGRTSLLSKRWRYVWTYLPHLDFEHPSFHLIRRPLPRPSFNYEKHRYYEWVNQVMTGNRASHLTTFRIHFPLDGRSDTTADIDKWIAMALSKNVSNLELNLSHVSGYCITNKYSYIIRQDFLFNNRVTTLKTIHLEALVVEGDVVEYVLSNCLNLNRLTVKNCKFYMCGSVRKTQVVVSSSKLTHLELYGCANIKSIQISAPNLTWFKFLGVKTKVQYTSVPALVNVTFEGGYWYHEHKLNVFSKFSNQLEQLSLSWSLKETSLPTNFPSFPNVKQLEIYVMLSDDGKDNLLALTPFIKACPVLHTLKLKLFPVHGISWAAKFVQGDVQIETIRAHKHLAIVEFARFSGTESEVNLALFLAEHAPMLNKLIFDPYQPRVGGNTHIRVDYANIILYEHISLWRRQAQDLAKRIRGGVDVVIL